MPETTQLREYETIYVLKPDIAREASESVATRVFDVVNKAGALLRVENWGRRKLAYKLGRQTRGVYVYFKYAGVADLVAEVERTLRLQESVLKFQTVKLSDKVQTEAADPEQVKFEHVEHTEDDEDETLIQVLGLDGSRHTRPVFERDYEADDLEEAEASDDDTDEAQIAEETSQGEKEASES